MSPNDNNKSSYGENLFLIQLPAIIFLTIVTLIMVISVKTVKPSKDPLPIPMLTVEESEALLAPRTSNSSGGSPDSPAVSINSEGLEIILKNDCIGCHKVDIKLVGPAYADIAAKYKNDKDAMKKLSEKIKLGGVGTWGEIPMIPHPSLNDNDIEKMVKYILSVKGGKFVETNLKSESSLEKPEILVNNSSKDEGFKLMKDKSDCLACHKENEKLVGPSFVEIANKYALDKDAVKNLSLKVKSGGSGVWGQVPMLPHTNLTDVEIEKMVSAILLFKVSSSKTDSNSKDHMAVFEMMKTKSDCYVCHKDREVMIGPSYEAISKKYQDIKDKKDLTERIKKGSVGVWGQVPMIPHPQLSEEELNKMVEAILSIK